MSQAPHGRILIVEDDPSLASGLASGLAQAGFAVTVCSSGELALVALRRGAMIDAPMRILIVEDDSILGSGLVRILQAEGYAVDLMPRGEQAVQAAERERFDLVILDIGLPGIDGFEVLRRLREGAQRMPVLVLTARDTVDDRVHGLDLGADDYLAKPFAMPELAARVRALIRRSQAQSGPRVVHGPLALDTVARRAFLRGAPLDLAAREWAVLEVLLARVERIVSKESIIQAVASWGDELSPNAIEVYVSRLRAKLEPAGIRIRTVRGFGYMLEEYAEAP
jgi:two-component system OmpR family response regulator